MAYIDLPFAEKGSKVDIIIRGKRAEAKIIELPFLEPRAGKKKAT